MYLTLSRESWTCRRDLKGGENWKRKRDSLGLGPARWVVVMKWTARGKDKLEWSIMTCVFENIIMKLLTLYAGFKKIIKSFLDGDEYR